MCIRDSSCTNQGSWNDGLENTHNAFANIYEGRYLAGVAGGMKLQQMIDEGTIDVYKRQGSRGEAEGQGSAMDIRRRAPDGMERTLCRWGPTGAQRSGSRGEAEGQGSGMDIRRTAPDEMERTLSRRRFT